MNKYSLPTENLTTSGAPIFGGHFNEGDSYHIHRPMGRNDWLIVYTLSGEGHFHTPRGAQRCSAGQIGLLKSGVPHEYKTVPGEPWNFLWAHFPKLSEIDYLPDEELLIHSLPEGYLQDRVYHIFHNILHDSRGQTGFWQTLCENSIRELILLIAQRMEKKLDTRIELILQYLAGSMKEEIHIEQLAKIVNLSPSRLSHLFKQETGKSVLEHLNQMRLQQAALLMEHMGRSATEASLDVGFNNYNHFAAMFRKFHGVSPRHFIKSARQPTITNDYLPEQDKSPSPASP